MTNEWQTVGQQFQEEHARGIPIPEEVQRVLKKGDQLVYERGADGVVWYVNGKLVLRES